MSDGRARPAAAAGTAQAPWRQRGRRAVGGWRARSVALAAVAVVVLVAVVSLVGMSTWGVRGALARGEDPVGLVGMWQVTGPRTEPDTWLRLGADDSHPSGAGNLTFDVLRPCGPVSGMWRADATAFRAQLQSMSEGCVGAHVTGEQETFSVPWLADVVAYSRSGDGWELGDVDGRRVAVLTPASGSGPVPDSPHLATVPEVTPQVRDALSRPAPLPVGLMAATPDSMEGRWVPEGTFPTDPHAAFDGDGTWSASDGCNGLTGLWTVRPAGELLVTHNGSMTLIGCSGADVPWSVAEARRAAIHRGRLLLFDASGAELARLVRAVPDG